VLTMLIMCDTADSSLLNQVSLSPSYTEPPDGQLITLFATFNSFLSVLFCFVRLGSTEASLLAGLGELFFLKLFTYGRESMAVGLGSIGIDMK